MVSAFSIEVKKNLRGTDEDRRLAYPDDDDWTDDDSWCTASNLGEQRCLGTGFEFRTCTTGGIDTNDVAPETFCCPSITLSTRITQYSFSSGLLGYDTDTASLICPTASNPNPPSVWGESGLQYCVSDTKYIQFPVNYYDEESAFRPMSPGTKCCPSVHFKWKIMVYWAGYPCPKNWDYSEDDDTNFGVYGNPALRNENGSPVMPSTGSVFNGPSNP